MVSLLSSLALRVGIFLPLALILRARGRFAKVKVHGEFGEFTHTFAGFLIASYLSGMMQSLDFLMIYSIKD